MLWLILAVATVAAVASLLALWRSSAKPLEAERVLREEFRVNREEARAAAKDLRDEVAQGFDRVGEAMRKTLEALTQAQQARLDEVRKQLADLSSANQGALQQVRDALDLRLKELQEGNEKKLGEVRLELASGLQRTNDTLGKTLEAMMRSQQALHDTVHRQMKELLESNQLAMKNMRDTFDLRLKELQEGNEKKLEEMRRTVDEKLHDTLEKRLGESFKLVSDRLEAVHKGLGEMQSLANGVGDLKRVLSNVKVRGTWAEVQLGSILEQILAPGQFERNVRVKPESGETVEFAIRLPGSRDDPNAVVWLPIDSKFPQEDYVRLQEAADRGDGEALQKAAESLAQAVRLAAREVRDKYVSPPATTDFAIIFLATEGLYAEVLRQPGLMDELLHRYRVVVAGPTTLAAILSSLRMGFQTLAIEQRAAEVWRILGAVKTEFAKFGEVLGKVKRQLDTASRTIEQTSVRTRAMERTLRAVERLPEPEAQALLNLPADEGETS